MADQLFFSRDTRVILEIVDPGSASNNDSWEIPVLDGFAFSQATNTSEITLNEFESSAEVSRRGRKMFNDSYAPAEWSFSTYARPFKGALGNNTGESPAGLADGRWDGDDGDRNHHAVEEALWACFVDRDIHLARGARGANDTDGTNSDWKTGSGTGTASTAVVNSTSNLEINFNSSNRSRLTEFNLYFVMGRGAYAAGTHTIYKVSNCAVNEATIDFDIEGIATISWSGNGKLITEIESASNVSASGKFLHASTLITEGTAGNVVDNFIKNRLTTLAVTSSSPFQSSYDLVLTGGSITFSNNINYLTPETLGVVNQPLAHVTGTRNISGSATCYLGSSSGAGTSADLFEDLQEATTTITNSFGLTLKIGGASAPNLTIALPTCHLEIPTHSIEDVISLETNFHALPSTIGGTNEATLTYEGV